MSDTTTVSSGVISSGLGAAFDSPVVVLSGGTAISTTVMLDGSFTVLSGGSAISTAVQQGGTEIIEGNTTGDSLEAYGFQLVQGTATATTAAFGAIQGVYGIASGGTFIDATQLIEPGGAAFRATLSGSSQTVFGGGYTSATLLVSSQEIVSAGATALATTATEVSELSVVGTAIGAVVDSGSFDTIASGGVASGTILSSGGSASDAGAMVSAVVSGGAVLSVGGTAAASPAVASAAVIAGGKMVVGSYGAASAGVAFSGSGGILEISGGTVATTITGFGLNDAIDLATLPYAASASASFNAATDVVTVTEGGSSVTLQLAGDYAADGFVVTADSASGTVLTGKPIMTVSSGQVSSGLVVTSGQVLNVLSGGEIFAIMVESGGIADVLGGGVASGSILTGGSENVAAGGFASDTTISGGTLVLDGGGTVTDMTFLGSGGVFELSGAEPSSGVGVIAGFGPADSIDLPAVPFGGAVEYAEYVPSFNPLSGSLEVMSENFSGQYVELFSATISGDYRSSTFSTGEGDQTGPGDYGTFVTVSSGGGGVSQHGTVYVFSGQISSGLLTSGTVDVFPGGTLISAGYETSPTGDVNVYSGGLAIDVGLGASGVETIFSGGTAIGNNLGNDTAQIVEGTAISTTGFFDMAQTVLGIASATNLDGGDQYVSSGGTAIDTTVSGRQEYYVGNGGSSIEIVSSGGLTSDTFLISGIEADGGTAIGTVASGLSELDVTAGGTAIGAVIYSGSFETISAGGVASDTTLSGGTLVLGAGGNALAGITFAGSGGAIDLTTFAYTSATSVSLNAATDVLTVSAGGSGIAVQLSGDYAASSFAAALDSGSGTLLTAQGGGSIGSSIPCFAAGTRITTARGLVAVERLAIGDGVVTAEGETMAIRWIGRRRVDCRRHPEPGKVWPVVIAAHAFGHGLPARDLLLSPDHAVFAEGVLIPAKHLANGLAIRQTATPAITYFHVELDRHAVILADGLPVESYLDTGDRGAFENANGPTALHPAFASARGDIMLVMDALGCAPLRVTGPEVAAVKARLAVRRYPPPARRAAAAPG